jgi:hypothetical protein
MKLNLGCGNTKITGCVNIDCEKSVEPDLVHNFVTNELPYEEDSIEEIYLFHTIEHIEKRYHRELFLEVNRVLQPNGLFYVAYPEFLKCAQGWASNKSGKREFWEMTIYGRQLYKSDYHVCIIDSVCLKGVLEECGFTNIEYKCETDADYNTILKATKSIPYINYEELLVRDMDRLMGRY